MAADSVNETNQGPELSRDLGVYAVFTTATGTMISAGVFILPAAAVGGAGPGAALSFLLAGLIAGIAALSVCELATAMPKAGGPYYFVGRAMGPMLGAIVGLGIWLALIFKGAFALLGVGQYVLYFSPVPVLLTAVVGGGLLLLINLVGAKVTGVVQNVIVLVLFAILGIFVVRGLFAIDRDVMEPLLPFGWNGVLTTTGMVFITYLGIVKAAAVAEEVDNPGRNLPLGILSAVALVTALCVGTILIVTGVLPVSEAAAATAPLADAGQIILGAAGGIAVGASGLLATLSSANAAILSSSRYPFAMARDGLMTPWVSRIHPRFRTPDRSILIAGGTMILLVLVLDIEGLAKLGGVFGMIAFALLNLSVIQLRWANPDWYRPAFRMPLFPILPVLGVLGSLAPIIQLDLLSQSAAVGIMILGAGWYFWFQKAAERTGNPIQPEYGLVDKIRELRHVHALAEKRRVMSEEPAAEVPEEGVVVELQAGQPNNHLLALAAAVAQRYGCRVDALIVTEVPFQSPLGGPLAPLPPEWLEKARRRLREYDVPFRFHPVRARDRARAILAFARPGTRALLLDWREEFHPIRLRGSYVDTVLRESPVRVAVLKHRGHQKYDRILVATAGSPYATAEVELADAVAGVTNSRLTLLMVLPEEASSAREQQAREYLETLHELTRSETESRLIRGANVVEEILTAGSEHDLIVLGATREPRLRHTFTGHLVGAIADEIAQRSGDSVLVTRDPGPSRRLSTQIAQWASRLWSWTQGGARAPSGKPPWKGQRPGGSE